MSILTESLERLLNFICGLATTIGCCGRLAPMIGTMIAINSKDVFLSSKACPGIRSTQAADVCQNNR